MKYLFYIVLFLLAACGMESGPDFATLLSSNKGLLDSVTNNFKNIEAYMMEHMGEVESMEPASNLSTPIVFDGNSNNNMEILPMYALKDPTNTFAGGVYPTGEVFTALQWTTSITGDALTDAAGEYAMDVFKNVRSKLKYVAVYQYVNQVMPKFTSPSEFETGSVDVEVVLFDLWSTEKLGAFRFMAESDSVVNYYYNDGDSDETRVMAGTREAEKELDGKVKWMIKNGLKRITGTEIGYYVEEKSGPYFIEGGSDIERAR